MHPKNPFCPTMHFNYRYFETDFWSKALCIHMAGEWRLVVRRWHRHHSAAAPARHGGPSARQRFGSSRARARFKAWNCGQAWLNVEDCMPRGVRPAIAVPSRAPQVVQARDWPVSPVWPGEMALFGSHPEYGRCAWATGLVACLRHTLHEAGARVGRARTGRLRATNDALRSFLHLDVHPK